MAATTPNSQNVLAVSRRIPSTDRTRYTNFHMLTIRIGTPSALTRRRFPMTAMNSWKLMAGQRPLLSGRPMKTASESARASATSNPA